MRAISHGIYAVLLGASIALTASVHVAAQDLPIPEPQTEALQSQPTLPPARPLNDVHRQSGTLQRTPDTSDGKCDEPPRQLGQYVVRFDQGNARFLYPDHEPFDDDEIILQICNTTPWNRYRLIFGSKTVGSDALDTTTVGYAATEVDAALRGANAMLANDHTCAETLGLEPTQSPAKGDPAPKSLQPQCLRLRRQVAALVEVAKVVMQQRDRAATIMTECGTAPASAFVEGSDDSGSNFRDVCRALFSDGGHAWAPKSKRGRNLDDELDDEDVGSRVNAELDHFGVGMQIVWIDDTWHVVDRGPPIDRVTKSTPQLPASADAELSLNSGLGEGTLPPAIVGYLNTRAELITAIQRAMDGYSKLDALSSRIREDLARRQTIFRLGRFAGNRIVVATLEEHTVRIGFTADRKHLQFSTEVVPHQLSLMVRGTSYVQFDVGVAYSWLDSARYGTTVRPVTAAGGVIGIPTEVVHKVSDGHDLNPVLFASFLWCSQSLERPWISRTCRDGSRSWAMWLPRVVVGLPLSADLGQGSAYVGLGLPYIPYVSLIGGLHGRRVDALAGVQEGDPVPNGGGVPTTAELRWGPFVSVAVSEEIFYLLAPRVEAAK